MSFLDFEVALYVMRFLGLSMEDDVPDHSMLSRFRTRLTAVQAWDDLLEEINQRIHAHLPAPAARRGCAFSG